MAETAFRVLETVLLDSKVSTVVVQSVSNEVHVNEDKTVFIELISQPGKENKVDVEVQVPKADKNAVQLDAKNKAGVEFQVPKAKENVAKLNTGSKKVDVEVKLSETDENASFALHQKKQNRGKQQVVDWHPSMVTINFPTII